MNEYRSDEEYRLAVDGFHGFCGMLLFKFAKYPCDTKDVIIRNFIALTDTMVRGVMQLWSISDYQDCWILNRYLFDRLFHLVHLGNNDQFDLFDDWLFFKQYNAQNRVRSDPEFRGALVSQLFMPTPEQKERDCSLSIDPPNWQRPKAMAVAKGMNLRFLYKYGYDYGSTHVHPMANDGQQDFFTITGLQPAPDFPDQRSVLSNSILASCLIVQEGLNKSSFKWRRIIYDFLDHLLEHLQTGSQQDSQTLGKIIYARRDFNLCEPTA